MDSVGADKAQDCDCRDEDSIRQAGYLRKAAAAKHTDGQHEELHEHEARKEGIGHGSVLSEQLRSRSKTLNDKAAHENCRDGFAGDTEGKHRDERAAGDGVVRGFGAADAFDRAVAEVFLMLGELLCAVIAHEACDGCAGTGEYADDVADDPGADNGRGKYLLFLFREGDLIGELCGLGALLDLLLGEDKHLRHREQTDQRAGDVDALGEEGLTEHEALGAVDGIKADGGDKQTERTGHESLDHGLARNAGDDGKAKNAEPELFCRHELQRELSQQRGEEVERNAAEQAAPEGRPAGRRQRFTGFALQGHLVALDSRCGRSRGAGGVDEYGGD